MMGPHYGKKLTLNSVFQKQIKRMNFAIIQISVAGPQVQPHCFKGSTSALGSCIFVESSLEQIISQAQRC